MAMLRMSRHPYLEVDPAAMDTLDSLISTCTVSGQKLLSDRRMQCRSCSSKGGEEMVGCSSCLIFCTAI